MRTAVGQGTRPRCLPTPPLTADLASSYDADVKSENILISYTRPDTAEGAYAQPTITHVHLIDFDMCCLVNDASLAEGNGSLGFMAPGTDLI